MPPPVSFIVIARNQLGTIATCIDSVLNAATACGLPAYEVIYVDSDSSDGSREHTRARYAGRVDIIRLTGAMNAAIARNVGARASHGDALFFIDGDMEIDPAFLRAALDDQHRLTHPIFTGQLPEKFYDGSGRFLADGQDRYRIVAREFRAEIGGGVLVSRAAFDSVGGFRPELRINEDLDLGLRLARTGIKALALPQPLAVHHTVEYFDWRRLLSMARNGSLCYPGALLRRHWRNPAYYPILASHQRPTAVLVTSVVLALASHPAWIGLYLSYIVIKNIRRPSITFLQDLVGTTLRSVCFLAGVLFFFPSRVPPEHISYTCEPAAAVTPGDS